MLTEEEISFDVPDISEDKESIKEIEKYIHIGNFLSNDTSPPLRNIEDQIKNNMSGQFIAIVVPTLSGKTQMAFTIRSKRPLYFSFDKEDPLYKNFSVISEILKEFAHEDRLRMKKYLMDSNLIQREFDPNNPKGSSYDYIAIEEFRHISDIESKTLGLFLALFQDGETRFDGSNWMKHYSRPRKITLQPISITDFLKNPNHRTYTSRYLIFLDEYYGDFDILFIRNLCRYVIVICLMTTSAGFGDINIMSKTESSIYTKNRIIQ